MDAKFLFRFSDYPWIVIVHSIPTARCPSTVFMDMLKIYVYCVNIMARGISGKKKKKKEKKS
ncbi:MAG: hypothetical protein O6762_00720 [Thaumarchaeota archaeon]|nr:hypothetical protein [Nitrososphaerota archaeon]